MSTLRKSIFATLLASITIAISTQASAYNSCYWVRAGWYGNTWVTAHQQCNRGNGSVWVAGHWRCASRHFYRGMCNHWYWTRSFYTAPRYSSPYYNQENNFNAGIMTGLFLGIAASSIGHHDNRRHHGRHYRRW